MKIDKINLYKEYAMLWEGCVIDSKRKRVVDKIAHKIVLRQSRYMEVAKPFGMPWEIVGVIHSLESSLSFETHLHNGDSLERPTIHVPVGRPLGKAPFSWEDSARDAISLHHPALMESWTISDCLFYLEKYNGFGYRMFYPEVKSPYLWSFTNHYHSGKYGSDGRFDRSLKSGQAGCSAILKVMGFKGFEEKLKG